MPILFLIVLIDLIGFGLVIPLLPFYATRFSASPQEVTVLLATFSAMQTLTAPIWGRLSDRVGRRPVLMVSMAAASLAYLWLGFASSLWMLFAARALAGACAGNISAANAYIADVTTPENRARGMGMIGAAFGLGFIIGPALGGVVAGNNLATADLRSPGLIACGLSIVAFLGVLFVLKESLPRGLPPRPRKGRIAALRDALARKTLARLLLIFFLAILAFGGMEATFALWAMAQFGWGPAQIGYIFAYVGVLSALMQGGLIGRLTARFGEEKLLIAGLSLIALGLVTITLAHGLPVLILAVSCLALGMGAMQPSLNSLISRRAGAGEQGEVMGVAQSVASLSRVLGPLLAGALFAGLGRDAPFLAGMALVVVAAVLGLGIPPAEPAVEPRPAE
ncbi:MAG TPA: MFS transporter [Stellaceae bacterium]|jgi:DHA1 family tetracycline resistance protein-like MFS transporter|nr:MFS transporter [Stellaceae bacterium]